MLILLLKANKNSFQKINYKQLTKQNHKNKLTQILSLINKNTPPLGGGKSKKMFVK